MHRFIIERGQPGDELRLAEAEARHALKVLRLGVGEAVQLSDGAGGLFLAELTRVDAEGVWARVGEACPNGEPGVRLVLYQGLPKFDKLEWIAQKATELGVAHIVPVRMERSVVKLTEADAHKRRDRMQKICQEAAKQCGRARVPQVSAAMHFEAALQHMAEQSLRLMPWEQARDMTLGRVHQAHPQAGSIALLIGPEGGIAEREALAAQAIGALPVTLGPRILRTETAAVAATALVMHLWGDL